MLTFDRFTDTDGSPLAGFFIRNRRGKVLAIGATGENGFVTLQEKRYARDIDLCRAIARLTGLPPKWNLSFYCHAVSSHGPLAARRIYERTKDTGVARRLRQFVNAA